MSEADQGPQFDAQRTPAEATDRDAELLEMFARWEAELGVKRGAWIEKAKGYYDLEAGDQWTDEDIDQFEERGRIPVVFNMTAPTIDAVCGAEIANRQQVQYFPREVGDTGVSDALTQGAQYVSDECDGDMEDSEAFRDVLICGEGWTTTGPEVDGQDVTLPKERVDPLTIWPDPMSRKACYADKRYVKREIPMSRDAFEDFKNEIGRPDAEPDGDGTGPGPDKRATIVDPKRRYKNGTLGGGEEDQVTVCYWEWFEKEPVHLTALPGEDNVTEIKALSRQQHDQAQAVAQAAGMGQLPSTTSTRKVFYRAFVGGDDVLLCEPMKEGEFRLQAITGKRNRNKGTWEGMVKAMADPQRFLNKLYSEILHIVRTNAKGGIAAEEGAVKDIAQFEESWAQGDAITWMNNGALSSPNGPRFLPKEAPPIPIALFQLMEFARDMVRACTGVNEEILGLAGREQPGVLEAQRKQAAYGILGPYFDAKRRYTRNWGRLFLKLLRAYMPKSKLLRIVDKGTQQYVPLAYTLQAEEYDVVVDEAPNTPNQKAKVAAVLLPLIPDMLASGLIGPEDVAVCLEYMDLPAALVTQLQEGIAKRQDAGAPDPEQAKLAQRAALADIEDTEAGAEQKRATAFQKITDAHAKHVEAATRALEPAAAPQTTEDA